MTNMFKSNSRFAALVEPTFNEAEKNEVIVSKVEKKETAADKKEAYQCPMKCDGTKTYAKKGKCPQCTMELKLAKK